LSRLMARFALTAPIPLASWVSPFSKAWFKLQIQPLCFHLTAKSLGPLLHWLLAQNFLLNGWKEREGLAWKVLAKLIFRKDSVDERDQLSSLLCWRLLSLSFSSVLGFENKSIIGTDTGWCTRLWLRTRAFGFKKKCNWTWQLWWVTDD
jgi:hypothetical protein